MSEMSLDGVIRPPQQRRSREALARVLRAAEDVLIEHGIEGLTIAAVAARADTSVGGIYRRFAGKEQLLAAIKSKLLSELGERLDHELSAPGLDLASALRIYVLAVSDTFGTEHGPALGELLRGSTPELEQLGASGLANLATSFENGVAVHRDEVTHPDPDLALAAVRSTIISASLHRGIASRRHPADPPVEAYARHLTQMCLAHLKQGPTA